MQKSIIIIGAGMGGLASGICCIKLFKNEHYNVREKDISIPAERAPFPPELFGISVLLIAALASSHY